MINEFAKDMGMENETGAEAPASVTIRGYYKGYSVLVTNRDPATDTFPLVQKAIKAIDWMIENGFKPSWADPVAPKITPMADNIVKCEICGQPAELKSGVTNGRNWSGIFCTITKDHVKWIPNKK